MKGACDDIRSGLALAITYLSSSALSSRFLTRTEELWNCKTGADRGGGEGRWCRGWQGRTCSPLVKPPPPTCLLTLADTRWHCCDKRWYHFTLHIKKSTTWDQMTFTWYMAEWKALWRVQKVTASIFWWQVKMLFCQSAQWHSSEANLVGDYTAKECCATCFITAT